MALVATAPGPQAHGIWRASVPGLDLGVDTYPARPGAAGYIRLWAWPTQIEVDDVWVLARVEGRGALPLPRLPRGYQYV